MPLTPLAGSQYRDGAVSDYMRGQSGGALIFADKGRSYVFQLWREGNRISKVKG